jgi:hypothetical protein
MRVLHVRKEPMKNTNFRNVLFRTKSSKLCQGPVMACVIGSKNPKYTLLGDTMNTASRMESHSLPGRIQCTKVCPMLSAHMCVNMQDLESRAWYSRTTECCRQNLFAWLCDFRATWHAASLLSWKEEAWPWLSPWRKFLMSIIIFTCLPFVCASDIQVDGWKPSRRLKAVACVLTITCTAISMCNRSLRQHHDPVCGALALDAFKRSLS